MEPRFALGLDSHGASVSSAGHSSEGLINQSLGGRRQSNKKQRLTMPFNKALFVSIAALSISLAGSILPSTGAGAALATAHAEVTVGSKTYKIAGGKCPTNVKSAKATVGHYHLEIGRGTSLLQIIGAVHGGTFKNIAVDFLSASYSIGVNKDSGTINAKGGSFNGADVNGKKMKGTFTC
jgi:hypothetical protein